jgi:hypothetical protein
MQLSSARLNAFVHLSCHAVIRSVLIADVAMICARRHAGCGEARRRNRSVLIADVAMIGAAWGRHVVIRSVLIVDVAMKGAGWEEVRLRGADIGWGEAGMHARPTYPVHAIVVDAGEICHVSFCVE